MSDPQEKLKRWLVSRLDERGKGSATALSLHLGTSPDVIRRMRCLDGTKQCRTVPAHFIPDIAAFFGEWPPGFEALNGIAAEKAAADKSEYCTNNEKNLSIKNINGSVKVTDNSVNINTKQSGVVVVGDNNKIHISTSLGAIIPIADALQLDALVDQVAKAVLSRVRDEIVSLVGEAMRADARRELTR